MDWNVDCKTFIGEIKVSFNPNDTFINNFIKDEIKLDSIQYLCFETLSLEEKNNYINENYEYQYRDYIKIFFIKAVNNELSKYAKKYKVFEKGDDK